MIDWLSEQFDDVNYSALGIALVGWLLGMVWVWRFTDESYMRFHVKIILTVVMFPLLYFIVSKMSDK